MPLRSIIFFILFIASPALAGSPIVIPASTSVFVGGNTVQFTSTDTVTWSLAAGSTGTISGSGLYTSPQSFQAKNVMDGCPVLPNDHIVNTRIDNLPVDTNSATRIANILGGTSGYIQIEVSFPHNVMSKDTPTTAMTFLNTANNNANFPIVPSPYTGVENNLFPKDYFAQDRHILGVSTTTCNFYEMYNFYPTGTNGGCPSCNSQGGVQYSGMSYNLPDTAGGNSGGATDAAGMYIQPLAFRYSELKAGVINHALRFTLANGYIQSNFIWPAVANANPGCTPSSQCVPYGARFRLKSTFNISSYSPTTQVILKALQQYGMFMNDGGTSMHIQSMDDVFNDTTTYQAINNEIRFGNIASQWAFDIVDESSWMVSTATGKVTIPNAYVTPSNYAVVIASKTSDHTTTQIYVALQPVTVGTYNIPFPANEGTLSVMAGTPQFQIPFWVEGATTTGVNCSMSPSSGTLTSGCLYTSPASATNITTTTVTITPIADSTGTFSFPMTIFPSDGIRMNIGGKSAFNTSPVIPYDSNGNYGPDVNGKLWWSDPPGPTPAFNVQDGGFPQSGWISSNTLSDIGLWYTYKAGNQDGYFSAMVPNGSYTLNTGFAVNSGDNNINGFIQSIDSQGQTILSSATFLSILGSTYLNPTASTTTISVTNNQFYFAFREPDTSSNTLVNKWSLINIPPPPPPKKLIGNAKLMGSVKIQ